MGGTPAPWLSPASWSAGGQTIKANRMRPRGVFQSVRAGSFETCALDEAGGRSLLGKGLQRGAGCAAGALPLVKRRRELRTRLRPPGVGRDRVLGTELRAPDGHAHRGTYESVSAGPFGACGLQASGDLDCWRFDEHGKTDVPPGSYRSVAAGGEHSCAVREGRGPIVCWGENEFGETDAPPASFRTVSVGRQFFLRHSRVRRSHLLGEWWRRQDKTHRRGSTTR